MVNRANAEFTKIDLEGNATKVGKTPEEILTIASLVQAEAQESEDFGKVSRVIYNRLDQNMALGFDSTINYAMGRSTLSTSVQDTQYASPYNTYIHKGLPPGPISDPGDTALDAALNPTPGNWLYFVTVKPGDTRFYRIRSDTQLVISREQVAGDQLVFDFRPQFVALQSSASAGGPYADESGVVVEQADRLLKISRLGQTRFYRLRSDHPTRIANMTIANGGLTFRYE